MGEFMGQVYQQSIHGHLASVTVVTGEGTSSAVQSNGRQGSLKRSGGGVGGWGGAGRGGVAWGGVRGWCECVWTTKPRLTRTLTHDLTRDLTHP